MVMMMIMVMMMGFVVNLRETMSVNPSFSDG